MKYWVIFNNKQEGPFTMEELRQYPLTLQTPVWHQGLPQWVPAQEIDELRFLIEQKNQPQQNVYGGTPYVRQQASSGSQPGVTPMGNPTPGGCRQPYSQQGYNPKNVQPRMQQTGEKRPSTYLGWAIAATLLCCLPLGVVAIIYAAGVNSKYDRGDIEGARKASDKAQLWIILTVTLGLIWMPIYMILQMLIQMLQMS